MTNNNSGNCRRWLAVFLLSLSSLLLLSGTVRAQTPTSSAVIMVQIQCNPGTADKWREAFEKEELPVIREIVHKGETFTNFTYFEAPLPFQEVDFILVFELKTFGSLDIRQIPPHWEALLHRLGPERFAAYEKETETYEKTVRVNILRSYKVK
jgi:hypothetical protein